jgi:hypothetical protein
MTTETIEVQDTPTPAAAPPAPEMHALRFARRNDLDPRIRPGRPHAAYLDLAIGLDPELLAEIAAVTENVGEQFAELKRSAEEAPEAEQQRRLDADLTKAREQENAAGILADEALGQARAALAAGKDPAEAEGTYRAALADREIFANRIKALAELSREAGRKIEQAATDRHEALRQKLLTKADEADRRLIVAILEAVAGQRQALVESAGVRSHLLISPLASRG